MQTVTDFEGNPLLLLGEAQIADMSEGCGAMVESQLVKHWTGELLPQIHGFIIRGTEGNIYDDQGLNYASKLKSFTDAIGVYGWHNPKREASKNLAQADALVRFVDEIGFIPKLGLWQDLETNYDHLTILEMREAIGKYNDRVESGLGLPPGSFGKYTRRFWWSGNVANATNGWTDIPRADSKPGFKPKGRPLWTSHPDSPPPYYDDVEDWTHRYGDNCYTFFQYTWKGKLAGIPGSVDFSNFNGTLAEYCSYFGVEVATPPEPPAGSGTHLAEILIGDSSLRRLPFYDASTLFGRGNLGARLNVTDTVENGYRKGELWIWDKNVKLLD